MTDFLFDMDGTIVDTLKALRLCYRKAGITMPPEAIGQSWQAWCPEAIHKEKERLYPNFVREYVRILPAMNLLRLTKGVVITGASQASVNAVRSVAAIGHFSCLATECTLDRKLNEIKQHQRRTGHHVVWVDDNFEFGQRVMLEAPYADFIHVTEHESVLNVYTESNTSKFHRLTVGSMWETV